MAGSLVDSDMARVVPKEKKPREVYGLVWDILSRGGKRVRPALTMLSCEAVGGRRDEALRAASAIELFHNFTLIHDDIEDNSQMRRGLPCLHIKYGVPSALNAGDGLFMMVWQAALNAAADCEKSHALQKILNDGFIKVLEGQAMELEWRVSGRWDVSEREFFDMIGGKTAALISTSCHAGAYLGNGSKKEIAALENFGYNIGIAFQMQDDILNLIGDEKKYKKEIGGDISEGKRTLIVIDALPRLALPKKAELLKILSSGTKNQGDIARAISILKSTGSIDRAGVHVEKYTKNAIASLAALKESNAKKLLIQAANYLVRREV